MDLQAAFLQALDIAQESLAELSAAKTGDVKGYVAKTKKGVRRVPTYKRTYQDRPQSVKSIGRQLNIGKKQIEAISLKFRPKWKRAKGKLQKQHYNQQEKIRIAQETSKATSPEEIEAGTFFQAWFGNAFPKESGVRNTPGVIDTFDGLGPEIGISCKAGFPGAKDFRPFVHVDAVNRMHDLAVELKLKSIWTVFFDKRDGVNHNKPVAIYIWKGVAHWRMSKRAKKFSTREQAIAYILSEHKKIKEAKEPLYLGGRK